MCAVDGGDLWRLRRLLAKVLRVQQTGVLYLRRRPTRYDAMHNHSPNVRVYERDSLQYLREIVDHLQF